MDGLVGLVETVALSCLEPCPLDFRKVDEGEVRRAIAAIKRGTRFSGAQLRTPLNRNHFLCGCLDYTEKAPEERLIVGYGNRSGGTTKIWRIHHVFGQERRVSIPRYVQDEIRRHHFSRTDAEVIVFHNHPRTGDEPSWLFVIKALLRDFPIPSGADRNQVQRYSHSALGVIRQLLGQGRVLFYLGESGYVREFPLPRLLPLFEAASEPVRS